ncbi:MAG: putative toxin-antitoxin system toxin component, PIN family [Betaproteobacteria bacterium]|nr:putative toxin-antitoxin system toxin component, PIN family [Betaproteobacteria bacterium]
MAGVVVVLDTQVWLDWLVFDDPSVGPLREAQAAGRIEIVIDEPCEAELVRVLAYDLGKFSLEPDEQTHCIARCRSLAKRVVCASPGEMPKCRDPDDQKFLALAAGAGARYLISKDQAVLALAPRVSLFRILAPKDFGAS